MPVSLDRLKRPVVARVTEFSEWGSRILSWYISDALYNKQKALPIVIDSFGGDVYSALGMIDTLRASGLEIVTVVSGKAMSAGAVLASIGTKRFCTENSTIMIHQAWSGTAGKTDDLISSANEVLQKNDKLLSFLDQACNKPTGFWKQKIRDNNNADIFLTPQEALDVGLITNIGVPNITDIFSDIVFKQDEVQKITDMSILMKYMPSDLLIQKNDYKGEKPKMDLKSVLNKLSEDERKPVQEIIDALEVSKNAFTILQNDVEKIKAGYEEKLTAHVKKSDEDFVTGLIFAGKLTQADKVDELEILSNLPEAQKSKYKTKLLAKKSVVAGEIPDLGEGDFDSNGNTIKAQLESIAKKHSLDLKNLNDLQKVQELMLVGGK